MAILETNADELLMLRNAIDMAVTVMNEHAKRTDDPYIAAGIGANVMDYIGLRQRIVAAAKPAPWPLQKALLDAAQAADAQAPRLVYEGEDGA